MKGLLYRDLWINRFNLILVVVLQLVNLGVCIYTVSAGDNALAFAACAGIPVAIVMIESLLNSAAFQYDENSSFGQFAVSSPARASGYLNSKIAVVLIFYGITLLTELIVSVILTVSFGTVGIIVLIISIVIMCSSILLFSVQLPFIVKFGPQFGMTVYGIFMGLILGAVCVYMLFGDLKILGKLYGDDSLMNYSLVSLICTPVLSLAVSAALIYGSYRLSLHFMKKDEDIYR